MKHNYFYFILANTPAVDKHESAHPDSRKGLTDVSGQGQQTRLFARSVALVWDSGESFEEFLLQSSSDVPS